MTFIILIILALSVGRFHSQTEPKLKQFLHKMKETPWVVGHGWNVVHDDAGKWFKNLFNVDKVWNITPYPLRFSWEKELYTKDTLDKCKGWSLEFMAAYNRYGIGNYLTEGPPVTIVTTSYMLLSFDLHGKYDFNRLVNLNTLIAGKSAKSIFQPYGTFGFGYTYRTLPAHRNTATINLGLGFNVWIYKGLGIQIQSLSKFGMKARFPHSGSNYLQHSIGVVYKITPRPKETGNRYKFKKHSIKKVL